MRQNYQEDWIDFILRNNVKRWKIFKILRIEGENDDTYDELSLTDDQFQTFMERHHPLKERDVQVVGESNDDMTSSYLMVAPDGKFYQNTDGAYIHSDPINEVGFEKAMEQTGFDYSKFVKRGGKYTVGMEDDESS